MSRMRRMSKGQPTSELERQLLERLKWLSFPAFERAVQITLRRSGLRNVEIIGRSNWRGWSRFGGIDIRAEGWTGTSRVLTLIQVKQSGPVQRRFVDELRGAMLRFGAPQGMVITTDSFSKPARAAADLYPGRPILLANGQAVAHLMATYKVGVRGLPLAGSNTLVIDDLFFDQLEALSSP